MDNINYKQLAAELLAATNTTFKTSSTPSASYGHGPGGLFSQPGMAQPLFSAFVLPNLGLQGRLPVVETRDTNPLYGILTGATATSGSEPTGVCDDPPTVGLAKLCTHSFVLGRFSRQSKVYDITRIGKMVNRGEFTDFQVNGNPFNADGNNPWVPNAPGADFQRLAQTEAAKALFEMAIAWSRDFARVTYTGNPTNNTAGEGYKEFYGLETLVNTGYQDAVTGQACPAADSIVEDFGSVDVKTDPNNTVRLITYIMRNLQQLAARAGLSPVRWVFAMSFGLFYELTELWPSTYNTFRNTVTQTNNTVFVDAASIERMRDEMRGDMNNRTGQYLLVDGQKFEVVIDDGIPETDAGGAFVSDLYILPMSVLGARPVTYWEYFRYDAPGGGLNFANLFSANQPYYYTTDNGRFMWHMKPPANWCVQVMAVTEPRLLLLTPYLAARITNMKYQPLLHQRSPFPDDPSYYKNGGRTGYDPNGPSYYPPVSQ